jgi:hypothetical protein
MFSARDATKVAGSVQDPTNQIRHPKKRAFLAAIANGANIVRAARIAKIDRTTHFDWMKGDPVYAEAFELAWERCIDHLEAEAIRRAYEGVEEPVFNGGHRAIDVVTDENGKVKKDSKGKPLTTPAVVRKYSDTLLIFLLNGNRARKYRQRADLTHSGPGGGPIKTEDVSLVELLESRIARLASGGATETNISGAD